MITKNPMQLKAYIKKKAAEKHISAQLVMQNYMLERLLERISLSPYKHNFIIKGGFLVSAIVGLDTRATMDLDTTIKGFTLTHEAILSIFKDVCAVQIDDVVQRLDEQRQHQRYRHGVQQGADGHFCQFVFRVHRSSFSGKQKSVKSLRGSFPSGFHAL